MTDRNFDWTTILPEPHRSAERAKIAAAGKRFVENFPTREELDEAASQGRAALERAKTIVDNRNETERLLNMAMDHIAGTLEQPSDPRAWGHLLIYCPLEILEKAYVRAAQKAL